MKKKTLLVILIFGSLWGCVEVFAGGVLHDVIPRSSVVPTVLGIGLLASARYFVRTPGSSTAIGIIACLFRLTNAGHYYCHAWAVVLIALCFDITLAILGNRWERMKWQGLAGISTAYLSSIGFSLTMTYIMPHVPFMEHCAHWWVIGGLPKVLDYVAVHGSLAAAGALILVPLGYRFGKSLAVSSSARPRPALIGAVLLTVLLWVAAILF